MALKFDKDGNVTVRKQEWYCSTSKEFLQWTGREFLQWIGKSFSQAAVHQMHYLQMDVTTTFLYGTPDESRTWYAVLSHKCSTLQFKQSAVDTCLLFYKKMDIWNIVYVHNLVIAIKV